jgi:hypothetical protein
MKETMEEIWEGIKATPEFLCVLIFLLFISGIALLVSLLTYFGSSSIQSYTVMAPFVYCSIL